MIERTQSDGERHLFTYGSLMFEPVWMSVASRGYSSCTARLDGFRRHAVRDESYPAVVNSGASGAHVIGRLYLGVAAADLARLDAFEGAHYQRIGCEVVDIGSGKQMMAQVYLFLRPELLLPQDWDAVSFEQKGIESFMKSYCPTTTNR